METEQFIAKSFRLLKNSGFHNLRADSEFIYMEDPSCILRSFETFIDYAWFAIAFLSGVLIFGWAISMIRGAKYDNIFVNMRTLILIFAAMTVTKPVINFVYGQDLFARACRTIAVSHSEVQKLLDSRNAKLKKYDSNELYEDLIIQDSGVQISTEANSDNKKNQSMDEILNEAEAITTDNSTKNTNSGGTPKSATGSGRNVVYVMPDGTNVTRSAGTPAWRNNNPGNIAYSDFAIKAGAIGQAGRFAIFPDEETGMRALKARLRTDEYNNLTVASAINSYAPPPENNSAKYQRDIEKLTGLSVNKPMKELTETELSQVANAIKELEGWREGNTERI